MGTSMLRVIRRLCLYPLVLMLCWIMPTIHRIYNASSDNQIFWLVVAANCSSSVNGLFNAMVYGLNHTLRAEVRACCCGEVQLEEDPTEEADIEHSVLGTPEEENKLRRDSSRAFEK